MLWNRGLQKLVKTFYGTLHGQTSQVTIQDIPKFWNDSKEVIVLKCVYCLKFSMTLEFKFQLLLPRTERGFKFIGPLNVLTSIRCTEFSSTWGTEGPCSASSSAPKGYKTTLKDTSKFFVFRKAFKLKMQSRLLEGNNAISLVLCSRVTFQDWTSSFPHNI
jgi:hypothetical protein